MRRFDHVDHYQRPPRLAKLSPYLLSGMLLALFLPRAPLVVRGRAWTTVSIVAAGVKAFVTVPSIVLIATGSGRPPRSPRSLRHFCRNDRDTPVWSWSAPARDCSAH